MAISQNAAFAGFHDRPDGVRFQVEHYPALALRPFNVGVPRRHHRYRKAGWYWCRTDLASIIGPFTSSRRAYLDAMAWREKHARAA